MPNEEVDFLINFVSFFFSHNSYECLTASNAKQSKSLGDLLDMVSAILWWISNLGVLDNRILYNSFQPLQTGQPPTF